MNKYISTKSPHRYTRIFLTAFLQVMFISANTYFISQRFYPGIAVAGFAISYLWTINTRQISKGDRREALVYSVGAMCGGLTGVFLSCMVV